MARASVFLVALTFVLEGLMVIGAPNSRIVGGNDSKPGQFPYQVSLQADYVPDFHFCGGSILSKRTILTAAHCIAFLEPDQFTIHVGSNTLNPNGEKYEVEDFVLHPDVDLEVDILHDVAVVYLKKDLEYSTLVQPIELETEIIEGDFNAIVSGWGYTTASGEGDIPNILQYVETKTLSHSQCADMYSGMFNIYSSHLCTLAGIGKGTCRRDSGGPLVRNGKQIGIVSFGESCAGGYPDVFGRISHEAEWIKSVTK